MTDQATASLPKSELQLVNRALELVRDGLRSGQIPAHNFDMHIWGARRLVHDPHCGSVGCIGGYAAAALEKAQHFDAANKLYATNAGSGNLGALFYPYYRSGYWASATPTEAADAIDRYLAGKTPWPRKRSV